MDNKTSEKVTKDPKKARTREKITQGIHEEAKRKKY